jgi:hypothetical protein
VVVQRWTLPGRVLHEPREQRVAFLPAERLDHPRIAEADRRLCRLLGIRLDELLMELGLERRARAQDAAQMLDAPLAGIRGFGGADQLGHVPGDGDSQSRRLARHREVCLARDRVVHLDQVGAAACQAANGVAACGFGDNPENGLPCREHAVHDGTGGDDAGPEQLSEPNPLLPVVQLLEPAAHVADAGHTVGNQDGEHRLELGWGDVRRPQLEIADVRVHVPESGDQELAGRIDHAEATGRLELRGRRDRRDTAPQDADAHLARRVAAPRVDDGDARQDERTVAPDRSRLRLDRCGDSRGEQHDGCTHPPS